MKHSAGGYALLSVLGIVTALLIAGVATITLVRTQLHMTAGQTAAQAAYYIAEAGVQRGIAQLDNDTATATTAGYAYPTIPTTSFGGGTYAVTIAQDPLYSSPLDRTKKQVTSTGTFLGQLATIVAHTTVQAPMTACADDPCCGNVLFASNGAAANGLATLNYSVAAATTLFNGNIFSNNDVRFTAIAAVLPSASGTVSAVHNFLNGSLAVLAVPRLSAQLFYGGSWVPGGLHLLHTLGFHFANGANGHGAVAAVGSRTLPAPNWDSAKRDANTVIVNQDNFSAVAPGSSWSSGAWNVSTFSLNDTTRYYVDGNVSVTALQLLGNRSAEIWARGSITIGTFELLSVLAAQNLTLVGEGNVSVGNGIFGSGLIDALTNTNLLVYSTGGTARVSSSVDVAADTQACIIGGNATYDRLADALSVLRPIR